MKHYTFTPKGVCSQKIDFDLDENNNIHNLAFLRGCPGNLKAIGKLVEGRNAQEVAELLKGNTCGFKNTSCADQFSIALLESLKEK